jgi:WD40 repeat protein
MDPAGEFIVVPVRSNVFVVPLEGGAPRKLEGFFSASGNLRIALDREGRFVAAAPNLGPPEEEVIRIWDLESGESRTLGPLANAAEHPRGFELMNFLPGGRLLSDNDGGLHLWSFEKGHLKTLSQHYGWSVASRDGRFALRWQAGDEGTSRELVWYELEKEVSNTLSSFGNVPGGLAFGSADRLALSAGFDGVVRVGPIAGEEPHLIFAHKGPAQSVEMSPDGRWIASTGADGTIRLWPTPEGTPFHILPYEELLERLRTVTNVRVIEDEATSTGYRVGYAPFPGWEKVPNW